MERAGVTGPEDSAYRPPALEGLPDEDLMLRVRRGDREAFRLIVTRHIDRVVGLARRVVGDAECEDIAQEVFLKLWSRKDRWRPGSGTFRTWLYRVAMNQCIDRIRRKTPILMDEPPDRPDEARGPLEICEARESGRHLRAALKQLPVRQRLAITLYYHNDLTAADVAVIMDLKANAVESLLKRGRQKLRTLLS